MKTKLKKLLTDVLITLCILCCGILFAMLMSWMSVAYAFEVKIKTYKTNETYSMTSPDLVTLNKPVLNIRVNSPYVDWDWLPAACIEPGLPIKTGNYRLSPQKPKNKNLELQFSYSIGCAENTRKAQMLALEAFHETEHNMNLTSGTVKFPGISRADARIKYCHKTNWKVLDSHTMQNIVVWGFNYQKTSPDIYIKNKQTPVQIPEPHIGLLIVSGLIALRIKKKIQK